MNIDEERYSNFDFNVTLYFIAIQLALSKKNLLSHLYWGTQWTMEIS